MKEQHLLVDYENVQPTIEDLLKLAPKLTDVWLFHGPNQVRRARQLQVAAPGRVTLVPHSGKGKNALDFHLSFYLGYVAAKHPDANLLVVANDKGYDSMLGHAKDLGFTARRVGFKAKKAAAVKPKKAATASAKKVASATRKMPAVAGPAPATSSARGTVAPAKKTAKKAVALTTDPKTSPVPKPAAKAAPTQAIATKKTPAKKAATRYSGRS